MFAGNKGRKVCSATMLPGLLPCAFLEDLHVLLFDEDVRGQLPEHVLQAVGGLPFRHINVSMVTTLVASQMFTTPKERRWLVQIALGFFTPLLFC